MSLLKRLGGAPQPNDGGTAASPPSAPPSPENGMLRSSGGADGGEAVPPSFGCGAPPRRFKSDIDDLLFNERNERLGKAR